MEFFKEHQFLIAQIIGFCAMAMTMTSFQQKNRKKLMFFQLICTGLWSLHFFVLGNMTGGVVNAIQTFRCVIFYYKETQKWAQSKFWLGLFLVASAVAGALTWENLLSILPILGMVFSTVALWMPKPKQIRMMTIPVSLSWLVYNACSKSIAGVCNEIFALISIGTAMWRLDRKSKEEA